MATDIHTTTVNRRGQFFRLIDGTILEFIAMFDADCNLTDDPDACVIALYPIENGLIKGADLRIFRDEHSDEQPKEFSETEIGCTAVNRRGRFFRLEDDTTIKFAAMLDANCEPTDDPDACVIVIYKLPEGLLRAFDLRTLVGHHDMWETTQ